MKRARAMTPIIYTSCRGTIKSILTSYITVWWYLTSAHLQHPYDLQSPQHCAPTHPSHSFFSQLPAGRRLQTERQLHLKLNTLPALPLLDGMSSTVLTGTEKKELVFKQTQRKVLNFLILNLFKTAINRTKVICKGEFSYHQVKQIMRVMLFILYTRSISHAPLCTNPRPQIKCSCGRRITFLYLLRLHFLSWD